MVTFVLQNLRNVVPDFDDWYAPKKAEMRADPLTQYFSELRTQIEKQVESHTGILATLKSFSTEDLKRFQPAPPGATSFFIGDQTGGSGWLVQREDGSVEKYYVELPPDIGFEMQMILPKAPEQYRRASAAELVKIYLDGLERLVGNAKARFCTEK
jgi:hypothetical protein